MNADYSTDFIPTYYPDGFSGISLNSKDKQVVALAGFMMKNESERNNQLDAANRLAQTPSLSTVYVTIEGQGEEPDHDL